MGVRMGLDARYGLFGAGVSDVLAYLPGAGPADVASVRRVVGSGSTAENVVVDSTVGLAAGDLVHAVVSGHDEMREIDEVVSGTSFSVTEAFSGAPAAGSIVDNGPEVVWRELVRAEGFVISKLPERYRKLLDRVDGEVIVRSAAAGQTSALLGLEPVEGDVKLYKNFAGLLEELGPDDEMDAGEWSLSERAITFSPGLAEGDRVLASYGVGVLSLCVLQTVLVDLATYRVGRLLVGQLAKVTPEWMLSFRDRAERVLDEICSAGRGVAELDGLVLYEDWTRPNRGVACGSVERG